MSKKIKVSVIMPAYNAEKYLVEAIDSILNQTFTNFELIIINDGSTDNTAKIVEKYVQQDNRIHFINNKENKGLIAVLNEGLDAACGEYIARMDSDDISLPDRFAKQVKYMDKHPECGLLGTCYKMFGDSNEVIMLPKQVTIIDMLTGGWVAHPTVMMRKSIMDKYHFRYDSDYVAAEDYDLWTRLVQVTEVHNLQEVLLNYRWHGENVSITKAEIQKQNVIRIQRNVANILVNNRAIFDKYFKSVRWLYFLGIPIIKIQKYEAFKFKYYLFGVLPIMKIKNNDVYLFFVLKNIVRVK